MAATPRRASVLALAPLDGRVPLDGLIEATRVQEPILTQFWCNYAYNNAIREVGPNTIQSVPI